jgi:hypothetical protein
MGESIQPKGRPWLYPYNRRLRHLTAIDLRYLTRPNPLPRSRAGSLSVDDEGLPQTKQSPVKLLAQKELRALEQTRSNTDLALHAISEHSEKENAKNKLATPTRPSVKRMRRRSTIDWVNSSPSVRQKRLEDDARARLMDVFFSLHVQGEDDPIYISEILTKTVNPTFAVFTLEDQPAYISRQATVILKVWVRELESSDFALHIEVSINLQNLQYLCKGYESLRVPLPKNCILFTLTDGIYTLPSALNIDNADLDSSVHISTSTRVFPTSSYDALMRLSTLDACIQDAIVAQTRVGSELETILDAHNSDTQTILSVDPQLEKVTAVNDALQVSKRRLESLKKRRDNLEKSITERKLFMEEDVQRQEEGRKQILELQPAVQEEKQANIILQNERIGQRRRICEDIQKIFPIEPIPNGKALAFTIAGLPLPNAHELDDGDEQQTAAALGHVCHVLILLSAYLEKPLPYPVEPRGSTSTVTDQVSASTGSTIYPLFPRGVARFRFEYAVFLVNKNIEVLSTHIGLKVMDARHTLPNLKYLLYITTAGTGDLPTRKAGGMRAFLRSAGGGGHGGSLESSRRGSDASSVGKGKGPEDDDHKGKGNSNGLTLPFRAGYKSSGLRMQTH